MISLASGPVKTLDSRAAVTRFDAELLLCLLHLYHKLAHCTRYNVDNVSVSSLSQVPKHCEQQRQLGVGLLSRSVILLH